MKTPFDVFMNAVRDAVTASGIEYESVVFVGEDPEFGDERVELHLFDVPEEMRHDVETRAIQILIDTQDRIPGVSAIADVYTPDLDAASRAQIMRWARRPAART